MDSNYINALERRAQWLRWSKTSGATAWQGMDRIAGHKGSFWQTALPGYIDTLQHGDTFFMNEKFCSLVEHARETVPDDLCFDSSWMQAPQGWLWLHSPFSVPLPDSAAEILPAGTELKANTLHVSAIGWRPVPEGQQTAKGMSGDVAGRVASKGAYQFLTFQDFSLYRKDSEGFGCWSYFMLQDGDKLIDRIRQFEGISKEVGGAYRDSRETDTMHEIRWIYSAFYLMAQRLAMSVQHQTDRNTRRRNEFARTPVTPQIRVITLRRMEEAREKEGKSGSIDWQWQWAVRGHWRNQYYPSENTHKPVFVESYTKGPTDKPFRAAPAKLFVAGR